MIAGQLRDLLANSGEMRNPHSAAIGYGIMGCYFSDFSPCFHLVRSISSGSRVVLSVLLVHDLQDDFG